MPYLNQRRLCLHSPPRLRRVPRLIFSGSYRADTDQHRSISDRSLQALQADPAGGVPWMPRFAVLRQTVETPPLQVYLQNIRKLLPR